MCDTPSTSGSITTTLCAGGAASAVEAVENRLLAAASSASSSGNTGGGAGATGAATGAGAAGGGAAGAGAGALAAVGAGAVVGSVEQPPAKNVKDAMSRVMRNERLACVSDPMAIIDAFMIGTPCCEEGLARSPLSGRSVETFLRSPGNGATATFAAAVWLQVWRPAAAATYPQRP